MKYTKTIRFGVMTTALGLAAINIAAQNKTQIKPVGGRDPFRKYQPVVKPPKAAPTRLQPPSIQVRIERYRAQKLAAANAHIPAPKPTTALLLDEVQVTGIFRTPRGWSAMVEATPLTPKLSYVVYPGDSFFDGQLVAIEEGRLIFRRDLVWTDGRKEKTVETKALRPTTPIEAMTSNQSSAKASTAEAPAAATAKPGTPEKQ